MHKKNITLIGMPGSGKSTVGVVLAKMNGSRFIDSDLLIQEQTGKLLHELITERGIEGFLDLEGQVNGEIEADGAVIAPGGSVVYREAAMNHLREISTVVYLKVSCKGIESRLGSLQERGVVLREGETLESLYETRCRLYEKYAHITVDAEYLSISQAAAKVSHMVKRWNEKGENRDGQ